MCGMECLGLGLTHRQMVGGIPCHQQWCGRAGRWFVDLAAYGGGRYRAQFSCGGIGGGQRRKITGRLVFEEGVKRVLQTAGGQSFFHRKCGGRCQLFLFSPSDVILTRCVFCFILPGRKLFRALLVEIVVFLDLSITSCVSLLFLFSNRPSLAFLVFALAGTQPGGSRAG